MIHINKRGDESERSGPWRNPLNPLSFRIAGAETVATFLAGTLYFLVRHPSKLEKLVAEIRGAFNSYEHVKAQPAQLLKYLQAVIHESLRLFPPGSGGAPRVSPGFGLHGQYIPIGVS
jgi:cytochrome P450